MKNQALFSSKTKVKKIKCRLLQVVFGALRVKILTLFQDILLPPKRFTSAYRTNRASALFIGFLRMGLTD